MYARGDVKGRSWGEWGVGTTHMQRSERTNRNDAARLWRLFSSACVFSCGLAVVDHESCARLCCESVVFLFRALKLPRAYR